MGVKFLCPMRKFKRERIRSTIPQTYLPRRQGKRKLLSWGSRIAVPSCRHTYSKIKMNTLFDDDPEHGNSGETQTARLTRSS